MDRDDAYRAAVLLNTVDRWNSFLSFTQGPDCQGMKLWAGDQMDPLCGDIGGGKELNLDPATAALVAEAAIKIIRSELTRLGINIDNPQ